MSVDLQRVRSKSRQYLFLAVVSTVAGCGTGGAQPNSPMGQPVQVNQEAHSGSGNFHSIEVAGSAVTNAFGISPGGDVVGNYRKTGEPSTQAHGFLLSGCQYTTVDVPGALLTFANGINDQGDIVGRYDIVANVGHGFLLSQGNLTTFDPPGATFTAALDINSRGDIVGRYLVGNAEHGFLLSGGQFTTIDVPGATGTEADSISPSGDIAGRFVDAAGLAHGYLLSGGEFTTIDHPDAIKVPPPPPQPAGAPFGTVANGTNARGDVVGRDDVAGVGTAPPVGHGFLLSGGQFTPIDYPDATFTAATRTNPSGDVTGRYKRGSDGKMLGFLLTSKSTCFDQ